MGRFDSTRPEDASVSNVIMSAPWSLGDKWEMEGITHTSWASGHYGRREYGVKGHVNHS